MSPLERAEHLAGVMLDRVEALALDPDESITVESTAAAITAVAQVVQARVAWDNRSVGTDPRRPAYVSGRLENR